MIASASNERQVNAIVDEVEEKMRLAGYKPARREGTREGRWVLLDYVDIVVHIQHQDERNFYALDRLWRDCPLVEVESGRRGAGDIRGGAAVRVRRLVMLRHGQTEYNAGSRMQGQLDSELTDLGRAQAVAAAEVLAKRQPLLIVSSDLRRAYDTAVTLGERTGLPVHVDTRLRETHLGDWQGLTHQEVDANAPGARLAWRDDATWAPHGGESRIDVADRSVPLVAELVAAEREWGIDDPDRPLVLVAHGGLIAALTAALLDLPVDSWPVLGGMGNASWAQLSGHGDDAAIRRPALAAGRVERVGPGGQRCPLSLPADPAGLLRLAVLLRPAGRTARRRSADLAQYRCLPTGLGSGADRSDRLDVADIWWAATQDPRSWAALPRAGAVIFATSGMDSLPSPLPTALREMIRYVRPPWLRRWVRDGYGWLQPRFSPVARSALPPELTVEYLEMTRGAIDFNRPGIPIVACLPSVHIAAPTDAHTAPGDRRGDHRLGGRASHATGGPQRSGRRKILGGRGNPDGIHWNFEAHGAVAELMLKALAEAGVPHGRQGLSGGGRRGDGLLGPAACGPRRQDGIRSCHCMFSSTAKICAMASMRYRLICISAPRSPPPGPVRPN